MKKVAILIGGWHYPKEFYTQVSNLNKSDYETLKIYQRL